MQGIIQFTQKMHFLPSLAFAMPQFIFCEGSIGGKYLKKPDKLLFFLLLVI